MITRTIDGVSFGLKADFDFGFLGEYGKVFAVFDKQDSGYLCFGVQSENVSVSKGVSKSENRKLFLKMAGAATLESNVSPEAAIARLQSTVAVYEDLRHPVLIDMIAHKGIPGGYLTVYEWFEGDCMGRQYQSHDKFLALPIEEKLKIYSDLVLFHIHINKCGYIALDFYDGSIMYDFGTQRTMICDIEVYSKSPVINTMGRMWGSSRYMSPEEFQLGAAIDERSNVFVMGATAFQLMGGGMDRSIEKWQASEKQYRAALRAISADKEDRHATIEEYYEAWTNA
ncbi:serine/threonine-protein kinase [Paenibacillus sp. CF384]|uniref:serine/threonine-protein kinase n=1 Tax=Paenibacillus sp. CF384 TaxID=1884382 RepID=UPI00089CA512|nr:serine/threonine-protein kinase [Paenibacillus sp. CF384]SDX76011.1 serine/threonine protein kinase [Paenibacillus sp. CF384]